jgi:hypothetical protein
MNCLTQFVAAFDDCFVYRYTKDFTQKEKINVRYVFGPKNRVLYDIVNSAKNLTLPVISVEQTNIKRDSSRIQFKDQKITRHHINDNRLVSKIPSPIPVSFDVSISIVANYKEDIDQIVSNFIPWCNPYFIISWKIPEEFGLDFIDELRTEVTWSGSVDFENPTNIEHSDKYKIVGNTSFNIKGWLFPAFETPSSTIYVVNTKFIAVSSGANISGYDSYWSVSANDTTDSILISAYPEFTNIFYKSIPVYDNLVIPKSQDHIFTFYGKRFGFNNSWYLSGTNVASLSLEQVNTAKFPLISAYKIPSQYVTTVNDNIVVISFPYEYLSYGTFTIVTSNSAGWEKIDYTATI